MMRWCVARRRCAGRALIACALLFLLSTFWFGHRLSDCSLSVTRTSRGADESDWGPHKLAVIVPFRDRFDELLEFAPHMHRFLNARRVRHEIFVVSQADSLRFNRAALVNIGFIESEHSGCDYIAMHDVDLLPINPDLDYGYPASGPYHLSAPHLHPTYHYRTFVGGILLMSREHFKLTNGLSNRYWGWGREDDEFYVRMKQAKLTIHRPGKLTTGVKDTFRHIHDRRKRPRDDYRYGNQKAISRNRDYETGVNNVAYNLLHTQKLLVDGAPVTVISVELHCDRVSTPWCEVPEKPRRVYRPAAFEPQKEAPQEPEKYADTR